MNATITPRTIDTDICWTVTGGGYTTTVQLLTLAAGETVGVEIGSHDSDTWAAWDATGDLKMIAGAEIAEATPASRTAGRKILDHLAKLHSAA